MKVVTFVDPFDQKHASFYVAELAHAAERGGGLNSDSGKTFARRSGGEEFIEFDDVNSATLYAVTRTVEPDSDFFDLASVLVGDDDQDGTLNVLKDFYKEAVAACINDEGDVEYWVLDDGFPE